MKFSMSSALLLSFLLLASMMVEPVQSTEIRIRENKDKYDMPVRRTLKRSGSHSSTGKGKGKGGSHSSTGKGKGKGGSHSSTGGTGGSCSASWTPIATDAAATLLLQGDYADNDDIAEEVDLGFDFKWLGGTNSIRQVHVSTNGQILINPGDDNDNYDDDGFDSSDNPRIAVALDDLTREYNGNIFMLNDGSSAIISYEPNAFYEIDDPNYFVNAQARLFADGRVNICFGAGNIPGRKEILAGLNGGGEFDEIYEGESVLAPLPGSPFDAQGFTCEWPTVNSCYCFSPSAQAWTKAIA